MIETEHLSVERRMALGRYCRFLLIPMGCLIGAHLVLHYIDTNVADVHWLVMQLFELDEENNLPTWFSSFLLLNVAGLLTYFKLANIGESQQRYRHHWTALIVGFLVLSIDEVAGLHETINTIIEIHWAIPALFIVAVVALPFIPFLSALPNGVGIIYMVCGLMYLGGAIGIELLSKDMDEDSYAYSLATAVEESMEMIAIWLFFYFNCREFLSIEPPKSV